MGLKYNNDETGNHMKHFILLTGFFMLFCQGKAIAQQTIQLSALYDALNMNHPLFKLNDVASSIAQQQKALNNALTKLAIGLSLNYKKKQFIKKHSKAR